MKEGKSKRGKGKIVPKMFLKFVASVSLTKKFFKKKNRGKK